MNLPSYPVGYHCLWCILTQLHFKMYSFNTHFCVLLSLSLQKHLTATVMRQPWFGYKQADRRNNMKYCVLYLWSQCIHA